MRVHVERWPIGPARSAAPFSLVFLFFFCAPQSSPRAGSQLLTRLISGPASGAAEDTHPEKGEGLWSEGRRMKPGVEKQSRRMGRTSVPAIRKKANKGKSQPTVGGEFSVFRSLFSRFRFKAKLGLVFFIC